LQADLCHCGGDAEIGLADERTDVKTRPKHDEEQWGQGSLPRRPGPAPTGASAADRGHDESEGEPTEQHAGSALLRDSRQTEEHRQRDTQPAPNRVASSAFADGGSRGGRAEIGRRRTTIRAHAAMSRPPATTWPTRLGWSATGTARIAATSAIVTWAITTSASEPSSFRSCSVGSTTAAEPEARRAWPRSRRRLGGLVWPS